MMKKIILDTDFLLISLKHHVDIFSELGRICDFNFEIFIVDRLIDELKGKKMEKLALEFIDNKLSVIHTGEKDKGKKVDDILLELALDNIIVCTQDKELKEKLKKRKIPIITIRQKKHLEFV